MNLTNDEYWDLVNALDTMNEEFVFNRDDKLINEKHMTKKTIAKLDPKKIKIDREEYNKLKDMLSSPDIENHVVAFSVLKNLDMKQNLPHVLLLYKLYKDLSGAEWKVIVPLIDKALKSLDKTKMEDKPTYRYIFKTVKGSYPIEDLQVVVDEFKTVLMQHVKDWGFDLIGELDIEFKIRE